MSSRVRDWGKSLGRAIFYGLMGVGVWRMMSASASYLELGEAHPFYLEKLPLAQPKLWLTALYVHVPSALFALPACLVLLSMRLRVRWPRIHRWLGRGTAMLIVVAVVPSGMYLACVARGGLMSTLGFWLTGAITCVAMVLSVVRARTGELKAHRRFSMHVTAQHSSRSRCSRASCSWRSKRPVSTASGRTLQRKVFVQRGNQYVPASSVVGRDNAPAADVCRPAPTRPAELASAR